MIKLNLSPTGVCISKGSVSLGREGSALEERGSALGGRGLPWEEGGVPWQEGLSALAGRGYVWRGSAWRLVWIKRRVCIGGGRSAWRESACRGRPPPPDTVNRQSVRTVVECILVNNTFWKFIANYRDIMADWPMSVNWPSMKTTLVVIKVIHFIKPSLDDGRPWSKPPGYILTKKHIVT